MDTTVEALVRSAFNRDIDPENVVQVLNDEGIDITIDDIRAVYSRLYFLADGNPEGCLG